MWSVLFLITAIIPLKTASTGLNPALLRASSVLRTSSSAFMCSPNNMRPTFKDSHFLRNSVNPVKKIADAVRKWEDVVVVGHYDADGIAATAIMVEALCRAGKEARYVNLKQLYSDDMEKIQNMGEHFVFVDFGAGQLPALLDSLEKPFVVIDHHRKVSDYPLMLHAEDLGAVGHRD
ncbi:TPA: DHH family phosphoesterase, partial [Candidatus Micrarchaeota archaeon]|nr:DHH family phosphoesterase [Candidatus Micrarchaeota archaeon]